MPPSPLTQQLIDFVSLTTSPLYSSYVQPSPHQEEQLVARTYVYSYNEYNWLENEKLSDYDGLLLHALPPPEVELYMKTIYDMDMCTPFVVVAVFVMGLYCGMWAVARRAHTSSPRTVETQTIVKRVGTGATTA